MSEFAERSLSFLSRKREDRIAELERRLDRYDEAIRLLRKLYDACETSIDGESEAEVWNFLDAEPAEKGSGE